MLVISIQTERGKASVGRDLHYHHNAKRGLLFPCSCTQQRQQYQQQQQQLLASNFQGGLHIKIAISLVMQCLPVCLRAFKSA